MKWVMIVLVLLMVSCEPSLEDFEISPPVRPSDVEEPQEETDEEFKAAVFAGGCFWCMESAFDGVPGVISARSGYTKGRAGTADYKKVSAGLTDHVEAVRVVYDPDIISYKQLLRLFWTKINPTDDGGQFADRGSQYKTGIFYSTLDERKEAEDSKMLVAKWFSSPIVVPIEPLGNFFDAEEYHQDYHLKNPSHYKRYYKGSGREGFIHEVWDSIEWPEEYR